jgi:hypothetical protein
MITLTALVRYDDEEYLCAKNSHHEDSQSRKGVGDMPAGQNLEERRDGQVNIRRNHSHPLISPNMILSLYIMLGCMCILLKKCVTIVIERFK